MISSFFLSREIKRYPFFFLLLLVTLTLGTLGLLGIGLVSEQVQTKLKSNAKEILTSDLVVSARRDLNDGEKEKLQSVVDKISHEHYLVVDIYSMVTHLRSGETRLVELRGVEQNFPFYGKLTTATGIFSQKELFVSKDLSELWQIKTSDVMRLGDLTLSVSGVVTDDSSQGLRGFSLAPRLYIPLSDLQKTNLLKPGSTGGYAYHYRFPKLNDEEVKKVKDLITELLTDPAIRVTLPEQSSEQTGRTLGYLTDFMALAALIGLILSLVGIFYLYQSHLLARLKDLCLLYLHGLSKGSIIIRIIQQFSLVFFVAFALQYLSLSFFYQKLVPFLSTTVGLDMPKEISFKQILSQFPFLYGLSLSILVPLLMGLLRTPMGLQLKSQKISLARFRFYDFIPFMLLLLGYSCYLSHSFYTGSLFFGALCIVFLFSMITVKLMQWILKKFIAGRGLRIPTIEYGIALRNLTRSGHKLTLSFLSLTLGATLISLILQLDRMIQKEFILDENKPSLFVFDIQEEQLSPLLEFTKSRGLKLDGITPMIRARLEDVNGKAFKRATGDTGTLRTREDENESRFRNRGINLTYRQHLIPSETLVEGKLFPEKIAGETLDRPAYLSLEKRFAQRLGLKINDKVTLDIQGVPVEGVVWNFREVKWTSFYPNFFVNVEPGFIDQAPKTYLAVLPVTTRENKLSFERDAVKEFNNISFIDIEELAAKLSDLFTRSRMAIEIISWLSLGVGLVILYGLSHDQVYRRMYDLALMKSMGFSSGSLIQHLLLEFGTLFFVAMVAGFTLGWGMALIIGREIFKISWSIDWGRMFGPGLFLTVLCLATILVSAWKVTRAQPRELLSDT